MTSDRQKPSRTNIPDPDGRVESIRARSVVLDLWHDRLDELIGRRGDDAECQALLLTLQYGARPPRHLVGPPVELLGRLRDALSRQIDLIVGSAGLDRAGVEFYRSLQLDLTTLEWNQPTDPIAALLERVCAQVQRFYEHALGESLDGHWPRVAWQLTAVHDHPRRARVADDPYTADGRTVARDSGVLVEVRGQAGHFGPEAYLSLPLILTREFFAHVPRRRPGDGDNGVFTEGFMDWAALVFFETAYGALGHRAPDLVLEHGRRLHDRQRHRAGPARSTGHLMARRVVSWWAGQNRDLDRTGIQLRVAGLAARLNVYDGGLTTADKDVFVTALSPGNPAMARALRQYLTDPTGPLEPLLEAAQVSCTGDPTSKEPA